MPALSPTMTSGTIVKWLKKEGDPVGSGDVLCEIQTDKAILAFEYDEEGVLAKILRPDNSMNVDVGSFIAVLAEPGEDWKTVKVPSSAQPSKQPATSASANVDDKKVEKKPEHKAQSAKLVGPAVRLLLELYHLDATQIAPSGPKGALLKSDVMKYIDAKKLQPSPQVSKTPQKPPEKVAKPASVQHPAGNSTDIPLSNMRRTIAKRLAESKSSLPHAYSSISANIGAVAALRKQLKTDGVAVTMNDFVVKAVATALRQVPVVNVQWDRENVRQMQTVDVSVAVATESGLITPIVTNADQLGISEISSRIKNLAEKAKNNKLQLHEFQGGTFTVSNLGMFGIKEFTAIINPPQAAILAVGGSQTKLSEDLQPIEEITVTLCYDNRAIEADAAAKWLSAFKLALEDPGYMLLGADSSMAAIGIMAHRREVFRVYKELLYLGRDYPKGADYFRQRLKKAFMNNRDVEDPEKIRQLIARAEFVVKEVKALYSLRKYRTMKQRYYEEEPLPIEEEPETTKT